MILYKGECSFELKLNNTNLMFTFKKSSDEEVDSLIDSMLRLIDYMNSNPGFKHDIFNSFNANDLNKILRNMDDSNLSKWIWMVEFTNFFFRASQSLVSFSLFNFGKPWKLLKILSVFRPPPSKFKGVSDKRATKNFENIFRLDWTVKCD